MDLQEELDGFLLVAADVCKRMADNSSNPESNKLYLVSQANVLQRRLERLLLTLQRDILN